MRTQDEIELEVFHRFARNSDLRIDPKSVRKTNPPMPDIKCKTNEGEVLAFELTETVDQGLARNVTKSNNVARSLEEAVDRLPAGSRTSFETRYGDALISLSFEAVVSQRKCKRYAEKLIEWLLNLPAEATGPISRWRRDELTGILARARISRGKFRGPCFNVTGSGKMEDPVVESIATKLEKRYECPHRLILLGYFYRTGHSSEDLWKEPLNELVSRKLRGSQFWAVYLFDYAEDRVIFRSQNPHTE